LFAPHGGEFVCNAHERENMVLRYKIAVTFCLTNHPNKCTILEEPRFGALK